ncbi:MAG: hypothetical protein OXN17_02770 [Candidatus Poribacteria bacterium]|nr:hypothetical protein [Candidatus Poribacteria bacterium]MDE0506353.1 hypothetical protein [Candidatus Poribacteria bacterium]
MTDTTKWKNVRIRADYANKIRNLASLREEKIWYVVDTIVLTPSDNVVIDRFVEGKVCLLRDIESGKSTVDMGYTTIHVTAAAYDRIARIAKVFSRYSTAKYMSTLFSPPIKRLIEYLDADEAHSPHELGVQVAPQLTQLKLGKED